MLEWLFWIMVVSGLGLVLTTIIGKALGISFAAPTNPHIICPHCQTRGRVSTSAGTQKAGISGGKATAALLTGGLSLLATGLSRKVNVTNAHCGNCGQNWSF
jgi:hypothetical protein